MAVLTWGAEAQVNTTLSGNQFDPAVVTLADGGFVVAWTSGSFYTSIYAQRFSSSGALDGSETAVALGHSTADEFGFSEAIFEDPSVAAHSGGGFVVGYGWRSSAHSFGSPIFLEFSGAGARIYNDSEAQVGLFGELIQFPFAPEPEIVSNLTGTALAYLDPFADTIRLSLFDQNGEPGVNRQVVFDDDLEAPDIAEFAGGNLAIVWSGTAGAVSLRVFDSSGDDVSPAQVPVNTTPAADGFPPKVAALAGGGLVVAWTSAADPDSGLDVWGRLFDASGAPTDDEFLINSVTDGHQSLPEVFGLADGRFVVLWYDTDNLEIVGRVFSASGVPEGDEFTVATSIVLAPGHDHFSGSGLPDGRFVVTWEAPDGDGDGFGIRSQIYDPRDGQVNGTANDDTLYGNDTVNDTINGSAGNDLLIGFGGNDTIDGGDGIDTADYSDKTQSVVVALSGASDAIVHVGGAAEDTIRNIENIISGSGDDTLTGDGLSNFLQGNAGNDLLDGQGGDDTLSGGEGNDWFFVDSAGDVVIDGAGQGAQDRLFASTSYVLNADAEIEILSTTDHAGTSPINLTGSNFGQLIYGNAGDNIIDGRGGADTMVGRGGNDWFFVDNAGDKINEQVGEGAQDRLFASANYVLNAGAEIEIISTTNHAGTGAINLTGNEFAQLLYGNAGDNLLNGGGGADTMVGRGGNDWFIVDNAGDKINDQAGEGAQDRVFTSVSYTLSAGIEIEIFSITKHAGTAPIDLTGNGFAQLIYGNAGDNIIDGKGGADTMVGRGGNDWFFVDNAGDKINEQVGEGAQDRVFASLNYTLNAGAQIEIIATTNHAGTGAINFTGNEFGQLIYGNAGDNILDGRGGADTLVGRAGNDRYFVDNAGDLINEQVGEGAQDRVFASVSYTLNAGAEVEILSTLIVGETTPINLTGNEFGQLVAGNIGANVLNGGAGNDTLQGFGGADVYLFNTALNTATNVDTILGYNVAQNTIHLENAIFTGLAAGALAAGAFRIGPAAQDADDRVIYDSATGALSFDSNGSAAGGATQFATLSPGLAMTAAEFFVV